MEARRIAGMVNVEMERTQGNHPLSHAVVVDGVAYVVPRRRYYERHQVNRETGRTWYLRRITWPDVVRLDRYKAKGDRCLCELCTGTWVPDAE